MGEPLPHRALLTLLAGIMMFGCAVPPPEKPIILRRPLSDRRAARSPAPRRPSTAAQPAPQAATPESPEPNLTPEQKADLFRQFDQYLASPAAR